MKKHFIIIAALILAGALTLSSCSDIQTAISNMTGSSATAEPVSQATPAATAASVDDSAFTGTEVSGDFTITDASGKTIAPEGSVYTITAEGDYTLTGSLTGGQIVVKASDSSKVKLILSGVTLSSEGPAILVLSADKVNIECAAGTYNVINDTLATEVVSEDENYDAAVYACCDLDIQGTGTLVVTSKANNGIKTKDDLEVKELSLKVTAYNSALKGNDSILIESGNIIATSTAGDAVETSNSDVSSKGNQRGTIAITGGNIDIYSACDGIQAAYDADISGDAVVNIYTASYAENSSAAAATELYIVVSASEYDQDKDYYAYFYNEDGGVLVKAEYSSVIYSGNSPSYYGLTVDSAAGYDNIQFFIVDAGSTPSMDNYIAVTDGEAMNTAMNGYLLSGTSGVISGDWVSISTGSGSGSGSSSKTAYSSKGIKASNEINITGGTITIYSMDDALHANNDVELENGSAGLGNINISGGTVTVTSADDGLHADNILNITGGTINVADSHEGLEANQVLMSDGTVFVYGRDDGINATAGNATPLIRVSGGYLDVTTPSGDTDAIDSNGNIVVTGGFILVKGGAQMGGMAGSVDVDGSITVSGGTVVALGGICSLPSNSVNTYASSGTSFAAGSYELQDSSGSTVASFELASSYSSVWISSENLKTGETYTLYKDGNSVLTWTQEAGTGGSYNAGGMGGFGGGPGGMGGFGGRR